MAGIDEVLERLVTDADFRTQLRTDPAAALSGYVLYDEDLEVLAASLDDAAGGDHAVEQRTSKSAFLAALTGFLEGGSGGDAGGEPDLKATGESAKGPYLSEAIAKARVVDDDSAIGPAGGEQTEDQESTADADAGQPRGPAADEYVPVESKEAEKEVVVISQVGADPSLAERHVEDQGTAEGEAASADALPPEDLDIADEEVSERARDVPPMIISDTFSMPT